jgi:hypothetical protein
VAAVDEDKGERGGPGSRGQDRPADYGNHRVLECRSDHGSAEASKGVDTARNGIEELRVEVLLPGLLLLGALMVIDREKNLPDLPASCAQANRRLAAVAADLETRPQTRRTACHLIEVISLFVRQEAFGEPYEIEVERHKKA